MNREIVKSAVIALGGNAISPNNQFDTIPNQFRHTRQSLNAVLHLINEGYNLAISHGNGPQVGNALLRTELTADVTPHLPLGICVADIQGGMGYMIQQSLQNLLQHSGIDKDVVTIVTQVAVDKSDQEIENPSKFIGQTYDKKTADSLAKRFGWTIKQTDTGDWRRVVPSPVPLSIVESDTIRELVESGKIVITVGGGGIPVYQLDNGDWEGFDAVVDKDLASAILACEICARELYILTDVSGVALNFGTKKERWLREITMDEARHFYNEGHFPPGTMGPKIEAAMSFLEKNGEKVIITSIEHIKETIQGNAGTIITR